MFLPIGFQADMLSEALARMPGSDVIPLTMEQARMVAAQDGDLIEILGPIHELVEVAASRPEDDLGNAADALLNQIEVLVEQYGMTSHGHRNPPPTPA